MNRSFSFSVMSFLLAISASAFAACGGGGYTPQTQPPPVAVERAEVRQSPSSTDNSRLDTSRFDRVSARLNLTRQQSRDVAKMEDNIKRDAHEAVSNARSFDANREFDRRLAEILTPDQFRNYQTLR